MNRIKQLREEYNISQYRLAASLGIRPSNISMYECEDRTPRLEVLIQLADFFDCSIDYIICRSDMRNPKNPHRKEQPLNIDGLDQKDLLELQRHIDYIKNLKNNGGN